VATSRRDKMLIEIKCKVCGEKNIDNFFMPYIDESTPPGDGSFEEMCSARCNICKKFLHWRLVKEDDR
jgi:hypothetical protein